MSRTSFLVFAVAFGSFALTDECRAQVGFGAQQAWLSTGGRFNVRPIVTNNRRYTRLGMSVGVSELVDVHTFSPVTGYPGLAPINPIGLGVGGLGFRPGLDRGLGGGFGNNFSAPPPIRKSVTGRFVDAAWKFDKDKNARLNRDELEQLTIAIIAELKKTPDGYKKLKRGARGNNKPGALITEKSNQRSFPEAVPEVRPRQRQRPEPVRNRRHGRGPRQVSEVSEVAAHSVSRPPNGTGVFRKSAGTR